MILAESSSLSAITLVSIFGGAIIGTVSYELWTFISLRRQLRKESRERNQRQHQHDLKKQWVFCKENARFHRHCMSNLAKWYRKEKNYNARVRFLHDAIHHRDSAQLWEAKAAQIKSQLNRCPSV